MLNIQSINHEGALLFLDEDDLAFMVASLDQGDAFTKKVWKILKVVQDARELQERHLSHTLREPK